MLNHFILSDIYRSCLKIDSVILNPFLQKSTQTEIDKISENKTEHSVLLTSLIFALDEVDNTLGHYASYLKHWFLRSFNKLKL